MVLLMDGQTFEEGDLIGENRLSLAYLRVCYEALTPGSSCSLLIGYFALPGAPASMSHIILKATGVSNAVSSSSLFSIS